MSDAAVVHLGENSPEHVALKLFYEVARAEKKETALTSGQPVDRKWVLDTYAECVTAVRAPHVRRPQPS